MTKKKLLLVAVLATVMAVACVMFAACGAEKHAVKWEYDSTLITVTAVDGNELVSELEEGKEYSFKVTVKDGYSVAVSGATKDGDNYKLTMATKDVTVKLTATKILNDITVVPAEGVLDKQYFDGQTLDKSAFTVTANYQLGDEAVTDFTITYGANGTAKFAVGDTKITVSAAGLKKELTLTNPVLDPLTFQTAELKLVDDVPVIVVTGVYNADGDKTAAKADVEAFICDMMERGGSWTKKQYAAEATIDDNSGFVLTLTMLEYTAGNQYFFHIKDGADNSNFTCDTIINESVEIGDNNDDIYKNTIFYNEKALTDSKGVKYYIGYCKDWNPDTIMVHVENQDAAKFVDAGLEVKDGKPYLVFNGTGNATQEDVLKLIVHLDLEDILNGNAKLADYVDDSALVVGEGETAKASIETNEEDKTFKVYILLEGEAVKDGAVFFAHMGAKNGEFYPNVTLPAAEGSQPIVCGNLTFTLATADDLKIDYSSSSSVSWKKSLLYISVTAADAE